MKVLVTGGAGFIGSHLVDNLIAGDHDVFVLDNFSTGRMQNLSDVSDSRNLALAKGDVRNIRRSFLKKLRGLDQICHLAASTSVRESIKNPIRTNDTNVIGTEGSGSREKAQSASSCVRILCCNIWDSPNPAHQ